MTDSRAAEREVAAQSSGWLNELIGSRAYPFQPPGRISLAPEKLGY